MDSAETLSIDIADDGPTVRVGGDVDAATSPQLEDAIDSVGGDALVLDLSGVTFIDSSGLRVLLAALHRFGDGLSLASPSAQVVRVIELAGLADAFRTSA